MVSSIHLRLDTVERSLAPAGALLSEELKHITDP